MKVTCTKRLSSAISHSRLLVAILGALTASLLVALSDPPRTQMETNFSAATPRAVEELTQHSVTRDYASAWDNLAAALSSNSPDPLNAYFVGPAKAGLASSIASQKRLGIRCYYLQRSHKLEAVFYSPEGDLMELHDTAEFDLRLTADGAVIHEEHIVLHYVVLLTPAADRWVIRQMQAVPRF
jgi:hypothetical protein